MNNGITFRDKLEAEEYKKNKESEGYYAQVVKTKTGYIVNLLGMEPPALGSDITCPFCGESGFDKAGLKNHLEHGDCDKYNNIEALNRMF